MLISWKSLVRPFNVHGVHNQYNQNGIAQSKIEESWASASEAESGDVEVHSEPDEKHLIETLVGSVLLQSRRDAAKFHHDMFESNKMAIANTHEFRNPNAEKKR